MNTRLEELLVQAGFKIFKNKSLVVAADKSCSGNATQCSKKLAELVKAECLDKLRLLRGYNGMREGEEIVNTLDWNFALKSVEEEIEKIFKED